MGSQVPPIGLLTNHLFSLQSGSLAWILAYGSAAYCIYWQLLLNKDIEIPGYVTLSAIRWIIFS